MSGNLDVDRFRTEYRRAVGDVERFITPERQETIARHNRGLEPSRTDLSTYLRASERRYVRAIDLFGKHLSDTQVEPRALEVGGFLGAFPLALARTGISVTLAEVFAYYGGALDDLSHFLGSEGVEILDIDFTSPLEAAIAESYTMVTNMAMLEHLAGSPAQLMRNLRSVMHPTGALIVEVPNIAYWPNRMNLLRGRSVHPPLELVLGSVSPFTGHHREYTSDELKELLIWSGFRPIALERFNYSIPPISGTWIDHVYVLATRLLPTLVVPNSRELIMALAIPVEA